MGGLSILKKLLVLVLLTISTPAHAQQGMTEEQGLILRQTLAADGSLTKEMHQKFWADAPRIPDGEWNPMFLFLLESMKLGQAYQRALWQSALISYDQKEVIRTEGLAKSEKAVSELFATSLPYKKGSAEYDALMSSHDAQTAEAKENAERLLKAAASHQELWEVNGEAVKVDDKLIRTVLGGLEASFQRVERLVDPIWKGN